MKRKPDINNPALSENSQELLRLYMAEAIGDLVQRVKNLQKEVAFYRKDLSSKAITCGQCKMRVVVAPR